MPMPTDEELKIALAEAGRMREQGEDPHHIAKSLLNCNYQARHLMHVLQAVELYFRSGMAVHEHQQLRKAVSEAHKAIDRSAAVEGEHFGLR